MSHCLRFQSKQWQNFIAIIVILLAVICTYYQELFLYERHALEDGEIWRLLSGHLTHLNNKHLILNMIAWVIIFFLGFNYLSPLKWVVLLLVFSLAISAGLYYFVPEIIFYGGFSGVLHGYFAYILIEWIKSGQKVAWLILLLLIAKVIAENFSDLGSSTAEYLDLRVVTEVHLIGVITGTLLSFLPLRKNPQLTL